MTDPYEAAAQGGRAAVELQRILALFAPNATNIELAPYDVSVNVVFFGGADLDPPPPLGTTDGTRYIKVTALEEAHQPQLIRWIEQAGRTPGWK